MNRLTMLEIVYDRLSTCTNILYMQSAWLQRTDVHIVCMPYSNKLHLQFSRLLRFMKEMKKGKRERACVL